MKIKEHCLMVTLVIAMSLTMTTTGCGGGGGVLAEDNPFVGVYASEYTRSAGRITIIVSKTGSVEVAISDEGLGIFTGTGQVSKEGALSATATAGSKNVTLQGSFSGSGATRLFDASVSGAFAANVSGTFAGNAGTNIFAGSYQGTFTGTADNTGTWNAVIAANGSVTGSATDQYGSYTVTGSVSNLGVGNFTASGQAGGSGVTATWKGSFFKKGGASHCSGTWESSVGSEGTWTGAGS